MTHALLRSKTDQHFTLFLPLVLLVGPPNRLAGEGFTQALPNMFYTFTRRFSGADLVAILY